jgi:hypothetical protein
MAQRRLRLTCLAAICFIVAAQSVHAESCSPIQFERGHFSGTVEGVAPADGTVCYTLATGAGQQATLSVEGRNVIFSIIDLVDARDRYRFTTKQKTYRIIVGQLMRSVTPEPFTLTALVR